MNTATEFSTAGVRSVNTAADRAHRAVERARERTAPLLQRAVGAAHRTIDKVSPAAQWISDNGRQLGTRSTQVADAYSDRVRARPFVSVAAALAIGYFVGKFLQR